MIYKIIETERASNPEIFVFGGVTMDLSEDTLYISMLGGCGLSCNGISIDSKTIRSKRIWTLIEYLVTYRNREVTQDELIELLYPDDRSELPLNALKTLVHRARSVLNELHFVDGKELIRQCPGGYVWNAELPMVVDADVFESFINEANTLDDSADEQLALRLRAIELYKGDFLPDAAAETWVVPITAYYRFLYVNAVNAVLDSLSAKNSYGELISVAQKAITIDPYEERLYYYLILALASTDQVPAAKAQYEYLTDLLHREFGVTPSKELQALYKKVTKTGNGIENDLGIIKSQMKEESKKHGAFCCDYDFFKEVYQLEVRSAARIGKPIHLCLLTVSDRHGATLTRRTLENVMKKLSDSIQKSLRSGDVYSRYSASQYVVLLPQANAENSKMVMERIVRCYKLDHSHSPAKLEYTIQEIDKDT